MVRLKDLACCLHEPVRVRPCLVDSASLGIHELRVLRQLDVVTHHITLAWDVHERPVVGVDERPIPAVWEVGLWIDIQNPPDGVYRTECGVVSVLLGIGMADLSCIDIPVLSPSILIPRTLRTQE